MAAAVIYGSGLEGTALVLRAQVTAADGDLIVQADITSIAYEVWLVAPPASSPTEGYLATPSPPTKETASTSLTVATVVFDTPGTWDLDSTGYNFKATIPAADLPTLALSGYPDHQWVRIDVQFTPTAGAAYVVSWLIDLEPITFGK